MKYRKKPVVIEAFELQPEQFDAICDWVGDSNLGDGTSRSECCIDIKTLEGTMSSHRGDFIICGVKGEFYPCKPDIFRATYEPVN